MVLCTVLLPREAFQIQSHMSNIAATQQQNLLQQSTNRRALKRLDCRLWKHGTSFINLESFPGGLMLTHVAGSFFFLWYGRSRSKARSLHEKKLLLRKLLHGHRWSHAAWQIIKTKTQTTKNTRQDADPQPDLRLTIKRTAKQTANGARAQEKQPQKICRDTVVNTHCVAIHGRPT